MNSRGDRKISWVRFAANGNSGSIVRTLQDTRLVDPIAIEDADNFATTGFVVSVADYAGKAVRNYRYGPVVFTDGKACATTSSCPVTPTGNVAIEYGGAMAFEGKPFQLKTGQRALIGRPCQSANASNGPLHAGRFLSFSAASRAGVPTSVQGPS